MRSYVSLASLEVKFFIRVHFFLQQKRTFRKVRKWLTAMQISLLR